MNKSELEFFCKMNDISKDIYEAAEKECGYSGIDFKFTPTPTQKQSDFNFIRGFLEGYIYFRDSKK